MTFSTFCFFYEYLFYLPYFIYIFHINTNINILTIMFLWSQTEPQLSTPMRGRRSCPFTPTSTSFITNQSSLHPLLVSSEHYERASLQTFKSMAKGSVLMKRAVCSSLLKMRIGEDPSNLHIQFFKTWLHKKKCSVK